MTASLSKLPAQAYVYVLGPEDGPQKIGIATEPAKRVALLQTGNAAVLQVRTTISLARSEAALVERYAHWLLRADHVRGEWFNVSPSEASSAVRQAVLDIRSGKRIPKHVPQTAGRVGRKKQWTERITLPLAAGVTARIDAALSDGEVRLDFIRGAIAREIKRRQRKRESE